MNDNNLIPLFISGTLLLLLFASFFVALLIIHKAKQTRAQIEKNNIIANNRQQMLTIRLEVQEEMLDKISRELHDNVGQVLSVANMNLYSVINNLDKKESLTVVENTMNLIQRSINDIRDLSHSMNSEHIMHAGLVEAIREELEYTFNTQNIVYKLNVTGSDFFLSKDEELVIYRITQEALNNIIKHARATKIAVTISCIDKQFSLCIEDNGIGFNTTTANNGIGLANIYQRASLLKASINIKSELSVGSSINLNLTQ
jgi:signal transduction histidine kinase